MALTIRGYPRRVTFDWSPTEGDHEVWMAHLTADGWEPDVGSSWGGISVRIKGQELLS